MPRARKTADGTPFLAALLAEMFATSAAEKGAGVHKKLKSGLHIKVTQRGEKRLVILWREGDSLPSRKECEVVARDAGFERPQYRTWKCKESNDALLLSERPQPVQEAAEASVPPSAPMPLRETTEAAQKARDATLARQMRGVLLLIQLRYASLNHWFRLPHIVEARRTHILRASLDELKDECGGRWFASNARLVWPLALLLSRWRHAHRALPAKATAKRRRKVAA